MMDPAPIEPATVSLVLSYLSPLDAPLPPHLLSSPLRKRHHFLALSVDTPADYLAWPTHGSQAAVTLLLKQLHDPRDQSFNVRYSADEEILQAHVAVSDPAFRLIFQWDPTDGWQYHNIALMPFPSDTSPTLSDALAGIRSPNDFLSEPGYTVAVATAEDDAYWDLYGQEADDGSNDPKGTLKGHPDPNSEDAYWARYSSIHGTADSTVPSPVSVKRNADGTQTQVEDRVFVTSSSLQPNNLDEELYNPLQPPSPDALSRRLASLILSESPPFEDENSSDDSDLAASPELEDTHTVESQQHVVFEDDGDDAIHQTIQGLYRLWVIDQKHKSQVPSEEAFMALVRRAIAEP